MKPEMLTLCIVATILSSTRPIFGFLTSQTAAAFNGVGVAPRQQQRSSLQGPVYADVEGGGVAIQPRHSLSDSREHAVYDPGDVLRALNAELAAGRQELGTSPVEPDYADTVFNELEEASKYDMLKKLEDDLRIEQELVDKSALLMKLLEDPTLETLPLVYVEEALPGPEDYVDFVDDKQELGDANAKAKRSRYYRRYPWKRHSRNRGSYMNSINSNYEPELRYACTPSKEDIFKLLVNLHENRKGNHSKTVNFCNRKRPAKAVFTNIRFLG
ncbi:uncharacterized protein LOC115632055 isoform X2 [Scaptodrosophila lebanonensis]|uniref:Uncharacterized protein LOC115632055 isoform X2 n=1 Tax=Drosophila lebanonensis TaxID=7225 RepID=A0A6J2UA59_DROLE|nr:uncharacterized protein LOC115632055 isoform X2 [Scaptodrosophila lebanonensis]